MNSRTRRLVCGLSVVCIVTVVVVSVTSPGLVSVTKATVSAVLSGLLRRENGLSPTSREEERIFELMERCLSGTTNQSLSKDHLLQVRRCLRKVAGESTQIKTEQPVPEQDTDNGRNYCRTVWSQTKALHPLSFERETARRRVESTMREVFYFVNAQLDSLSSIKFSAKGAQEDFINNMKTDIINYKRAMTNDLHALRHVDKDEEWRVNESRELGELVQGRLHSLQNPKSCNETRFLTCNLGRKDGFFSLLHEGTVCLLTAYVVRRKMVLTTNGWKYAPTTWDTFLRPPSDNCTGADTKVDSKTNDSAARNMEFRSVIGDWNMSPAKFIPRAIPADLAKRLKAFHGDPPTWWVGQLVSYLLRPQSHLEETIKAQAERMRFQRPIVGIQVRRTDKINSEGVYHSLEEYMQHVQEYYDTREQRERIKERRLFVATDDASVFTELQEKYPNYHISRVEGSTNVSSLQSRYTKGGLSAILVDLHFLSMCDFVVCAYTSNICRAVNELMQTRHSDASSNVYSLEGSVYYVTYGDIHHNRAVISHETRSPQEISLQVGDLVYIQSYLFGDSSRRVVGNLRNGFTIGINNRTRQKGLFPSYKVVEEIVEETMG